MNTREIASQFVTEGTIAEITPHGGGHINDSYHMVNSEAALPDYLLQRINHFVFKDPALLMRNMTLVTDHIRAKLKSQGVEDLDRRTLTIIPARDGNSFFRDPEDNFWRILRFIEDHRVFESTTDTAIAYEGARMFGEFSKMLNDLAVEQVGTIIPDFHNMKWRLTQLEQSIKADKADRLKLVKKEIDYIEARSGMMLTIHELGMKGEIPLRVTHNDTKISNVLFDQENKGLSVIDLDTIQPGYITSDFGDGIRTLTNTGEEDDEQLERVTMNIELFEAFASGFLDATRDILSETEKGVLLNAGLMFPYMQAVRFLIDYLDGDIYYKTKHKEHNLVRTRAQLKLLQDGEAKMDRLKSIMQNLY